LNQNTRQRLIGTLVLAVVALVLLPVIFDGEGSYQPVLQTSIPERPTRPEAARTDPQRPVITADTDAIRLSNVPDTGADPDATSVVSTPASETDTTADPESGTVAGSSQSSQSSPAPAQTPDEPETTPATASTATTTAPTLDNQGLPEGFSVRLASFGNATNASNLVTRLQDAGHRAYTRRMDSSQGILTGVFVGPVVDRNAAATLLEQLRQDFELNGLIVRYEIEPL
jgi:DedD protein